MVTRRGWRRNLGGRTRKWIDKMVKEGHVKITDVSGSIPRKRPGSYAYNMTMVKSGHRIKVFEIKKKGSGKGKGWHGDAAGHARAAKKRKK